MRVQNADIESSLNHFYVVLKCSLIVICDNTKVYICLRYQCIIILSQCGNIL